MTDILSRKTALRSALRQQRRSLSSAAQAAAAQALTRAVLDLPSWAGAQRIALYLARDGEIDTSPLARMARDASKQVFLPVLTEDNSLSFARWQTDDTQVSNRFNIPEPPGDAAQCPASDLDIIFLPVVGWDTQGGRLGMGGGYYDRALSGITRPVLVGLAHDSQRVERIPRERWDIALNYIATETALHRSQNRY